MKQVVTTVKRGKHMLGQVISDPSNRQNPFHVQVTLNGELFDGGDFFDEDEAVSYLDQFMYEVYQDKYGKKPNI